MSLPKLMIFATVILFAIIGIAAFKKNHSQQKTSPTIAVQDLEDADIETPIADEPMQETPIEDTTLPVANRIEELFNKREPRLPIVETITYKAFVPWKKGKAAWITDYASHYKTSRHFIARSLNGRPDYEKQEIVEGARFNVLRQDKPFSFYLLVDVLTSKLWFYYVDDETNDQVLIKTYDVGLGRPDPGSPSGLLTPLGVYTLGEKVGIYRPKMTQFYQGEKTEMIRVFGTRWIPFSEEVVGCTSDARGYGIHGLPWTVTESGELREDTESLRQYLSDGCIRLSQDDIEELFSIIITKPTQIEIVRGFQTAHTPQERKNG